MICAKEYVEKVKENTIRVYGNKNMPTDVDIDEAIMVLTTYKNCEGFLNRRLEAAASRGERSITLELGGNYYCGELYKENQRYADGRKSYNYKNEFVYDLLIQYLIDHCYTIYEQPIYYDCYGSGNLEGKRLIIEA